MTYPRVLVFDSGIGGLSVASCITRALPSLKLVYLADSEGFPYGGQAESVVIDRTRALIGSALADYPCDLVVIACNTASTVALPTLRAMTATPVIGVVPAIKPAAGLSRNRRIGVLATPATIAGPYLAELVETFASDCVIESVGVPELVSWIERRLSGEDIPVDQLDDRLQPFRKARVDTLVLGCTHYPLITPLLKELLPEVRYWVDSGDAIARRVTWMLEQAGIAIDGPVAEPGSQVRENPLEVALFTGEIPAGLKPFLAEMELEADQLRGSWPTGY